MVPEVLKCPRCNYELIQTTEHVSMVNATSGTKVVGGSTSVYEGSIDFYVAPGAEITIKYYKCSNPDCPYLKRDNRIM